MTASEKIEILFDNLDNAIILLHIGEDLVSHGKLICDITHEVREEVKEECGFIFPKVHVQDNFLLQENEFVIYIQGNQVGNGFLIPNEAGIRDEFYDSLKTILYNNLDKLFTNELAERYIDTVQRKNGWLVWNIAKVLSVPEIKIILSDIISSGKSINNIGYVFEKIGEQVLLNGGYQDCYRSLNPHNIAINVAKIL